MKHLVAARIVADARSGHPRTVGDLVCVRGLVEIDAGSGPGPIICTSNQFWTQGNNGSTLMHPGGNCVSCHASSGEDEVPRFTIAGTVYPTLREPNDCNGINGAGAQVVIVDANGQTLTLSVNAVGNFFSTAEVARAFRAKVVRGGLQRVMSAAQMTGDRNSCHTTQGANGAPGRIMAP